MPKDKEGAQGGQGDTGGSSDQKIKVGDKEYSADDVSNIISQVQTLTKKGGDVQGIIDTCARYEMEPGDFLDQSTGALTVINNLIKDGVIDEQGQAVKKVVTKEKEGDELGELLNLDTKGEKKPKPSKADDAVIKGLTGIETSVSNLTKTVGRLEGIQTSMIHEQYREKIRTKHPNLSDKDADQILALAMNEGKKDVWGYAEDVSKAKGADVEQIEREYAKKRGLDYEALKEADENKLNEQDDKGGGAPKLEGKKIKFNASGKDEITPLEASQAFLEKNLRGD